MGKKTTLTDDNGVQWELRGNREADGYKLYPIGSAGGYYEYEVYLDESGRHWIKLDGQMIWNSEIGYGNWNDGGGLIKEVNNE